MAGKGMGCATKGGGCVESGPRNRMMSKTSERSGPVMMKKGGPVDMRKACGGAVKKMKKGGAC
jgi:hypothetical protein